MRILQLITGLRLGGAEKQLLLLSVNMKQAGHSVKVVAMEKGGVLAQEFMNEDIEVIELDIRKITDIYAGYRKFSAVVKAYQPHVIHSHMIHANFLARIFKLFNRQFKVVTTAHNIKEGSKAMMLVAYRLTKSIPNWSTNVSIETYEYFLKRKYFKKQASSFVPNIIDTNLFNPALLADNDLRSQLGLPKDAYIYFSAGRLHTQKNHKLLLKAFNVVHQQIDNAYLIIAGEGPLLPDLLTYCEDNNLISRVVFLGRRTDMPQLMAMCNCFVLSSDFEGFGMVIGEAMAMLKPVITTNCGGVEEVTGGYGTLVKVNDANGLAAAMLWQYRLPITINELINARKHIEVNYAASSIIKQWINIYRN